MNLFCSQCGSSLNLGDRFCQQCGAAVSQVAEQPVAQASVQPEISKKQKKKAKKKPPKKAPKKKKKGKPVFLIVLASIIALLAFAWFAVGNYFTLQNHTDKVLESFNSGNLDLDKFQSDPYEDLPLYVIDMMGESSESAELGPIATAMTPYLSFERVKINGFFGAKEVEYRIVSRDLESWLLSLDYSAVSSAEQLQQMMIDYIPNAPLREFSVTIQYERDGLFDWTGNYETPEFADAITGGLNSAYNELYERMMKEMEDLLG